MIATNYERIHRSNLVGMGVMPLQFVDGQNWQSLGLTGEETFDIEVDDSLKPLSTIDVQATSPDGSSQTFKVQVRVDTPVEMDYFRNRGILQTVLRRLLKEA